MQKLKSNRQLIFWREENDAGLRRILKLQDFRSLCNKFETAKWDFLN